MTLGCEGASCLLAKLQVQDGEGYWMVLGCNTEGGRRAAARPSVLFDVICSVWRSG